MNSSNEKDDAYETNEGIIYRGGLEIAHEIIERRSDKGKIKMKKTSV